MKLLNAVTCAVLLLSSSALARGKDFEEAITPGEATRLVKALGELEARHTQAGVQMDKLKKDPDVFKTPALTQAASATLKSHATIGVFLVQLREGIAKRDGKVHAYELELKGEIDELEARLAQLREQAGRAEVPTVKAIAIAALVIANELDTQYLIFDANYEVAVADVDLLMLPSVDVYAAVRFSDPFLAAQPGGERSRWESAQRDDP
jgi:hypothetical protein